ncbi:hypothetical protein SODALDRAFT_360398 [Sodiomyces alkalinus F11]|uniref:Uncharacterized protein n=1 Tax=Sodiomyces alkalinus (strain CBS 110278 / VKM F-3762 / F11) TaxID=1314773 RepID=A0A3N2PU84_SODAK|nr:hypothetical protein SODALDRAFT_360398 [Sodiomyces alkalinus F11]ROT38067.1 hypothetical protein SODALDRAFT_360398 [Sodiomyces alkalinus F11]
MCRPTLLPTGFNHWLGPRSTTLQSTTSCFGFSAAFCFPSTSLFIIYLKSTTATTRPRDHASLPSTSSARQQPSAARMPERNPQLAFHGHLDYHDNEQLTVSGPSLRRRRVLSWWSASLTRIDWKTAKDLRSLAANGHTPNRPSTGQQMGHGKKTAPYLPYPIHLDELAILGTLGSKSSMAAHVAVLMSKCAKDHMVVSTTYFLRSHAPRSWRKERLQQTYDGPRFGNSPRQLQSYSQHELTTRAMPSSTPHGHETTIQYLLSITVLQCCTAAVACAPASCLQ